MKVVPYQKLFIVLVKNGLPFDDPKFIVLKARAHKMRNLEPSKVVKRKANFDQTSLKMNNF